MGFWGLCAAPIVGISVPPLAPFTQEPRAPGLHPWQGVRTPITRGQWLSRASEPGPTCWQQEVIQPQVPLRLPCYDFSPLAGAGFDPALADGASPHPRSGGATGGVCKEQGRIHRAMLTRGY